MKPVNPFGWLTAAGHAASSPAGRPKIPKPPRMDRLAAFPVEQVLPLLRRGSDRFQVLAGQRVSVGQNRLFVFAAKGTACTACGVEGAFFAVERHWGALGYHLNLYAVKVDGTVVLMTRDHIVPHSRGGKGGMENSQPMCDPCNRRKADTMPGEVRRAA